MTSWTSPKTFDSGDTLTAAELNTYNRDNLLYLYEQVGGLGAYAVSLKRTSSQSITDATNNDVTWQAEDLDLGSWWSSGTDITVPAAAVPTGFTTVLVLMLANVRFVSNSAGGRAIDFVQNGSVVDGIAYPAINGDATAVAYVKPLLAEAGDILKVQVRQNSGGALDMDVAKVSVIRLFPAT